MGMACLTHRDMRPTHNLDSCLTAALIVSLLTPALYLPALLTKDVESFFTSLMTGLLLSIIYPVVLPLLFAAVVISTVAVGHLFSALRLRHVAHYALAGAGVAFAAYWSLPALTPFGQHIQPFAFDSLHGVRNAIGTGIAGLFCGALYWLIAGKLTRNKSVPPFVSSEG
jgi:hypothetical protein